MNQPEGQSTGDDYQSHLQVIGGTDQNYTQTPHVDTTGGPGGGGGGNWMETRVTVLEAQVQNINTNITKIEDDVRDQRNWGIGLIGVLIGAVAGLYLYTDSKTTKIVDQLTDIRLGVVEDISEVKNDINLIKAQNGRIIHNINGLTTSINKLVGIDPTNVGKE